MPTSYTTAFPNGVSAGDVTQRSAVLWTRAVEPGHLRLQVATDPSFRHIVETEKVFVTDPTVPVKIEVDHLRPGTEYYYRFIDASGDVIQGSFETADRPGTHDGFHFGVISDAHGAEFAPFVALRNAADADLDLLIKLGDEIHAEAPAPGAMTLAEFRAEHNDTYSAHLGTNYLADLQATTSILSMLDDAELRNNWAGGASPSTDPRFAGQSGDFINETPLYRNALQAFSEYNAIENHTYRHTGDDRFDGAPDLYRYNTYGSDASIIMLDARSFRDVEVPTPLNPLNPIEVITFLAASFEPGRTMLGGVQLERLMQDLLDARDQGVTWNFVVLPEPIQNFGPIVDAGDRFEGYAAERAALLTARNDRLNGTAADDVIIGAAGNDKLQGGNGSDYLDGGRDDDDIAGGLGNDRIFGRAGNDELSGNDGDDRISGGDGRDELDGGRGADVLDGGAGRDEMTGGAGSDTFVFAPDFGTDRIGDFDANPAGGQDFLDISAFGIAGADFASRVSIRDVGADTLVVIDGDADQSIRLLGIGNASTVTQDDFLI